MNDEQAMRVIDMAIENYNGDVRILESAIGAFLVGRRVGWRPLLLMHTAQTYRNYQKILGLDFGQVLRESEPLARKSVAWRLVGYVDGCASAFWDVVNRKKPGKSVEFGSV